MLQRLARCRADFPIAARGAGLQAMGADLGLFPGSITTFLYGKHCLRNLPKWPLTGKISAQIR
jgi:hypothetical protein